MPGSFETVLPTLPPDIDVILRFCTDYDCSDLFVTEGEPCYIYRYGILYKTSRPIDVIGWNNFAGKAITSEQNSKYVRNKMLDFSYQLGDKYRYRASAGFSREKHICTFRMITKDLPTFAKLKMDKQVVDLLDKAFRAKSGITMLVGATGSGKTTTLSCCINEFSQGTQNALCDANLITMEDPIEYTYPSHSRCRITQKELGIDFASFDLGIKQALREHPTHILVGETRDRDTIRALVEAARTGHSVISTFHTSSCADTVARLYSYLAGQNEDVMYDLISNMNFILCQRLNKGRKRYTLEYQYMFFTDKIIEILIRAISKNMNIPDTMNKLMTNESLLRSGTVSGWKSV